MALEQRGVRSNMISRKTHAAYGQWKLSVVIPVYNEKATIREIIERVFSTAYDKEVIVVDDGSSDGTTEEIKRLEKSFPLKAIYREKNNGKGAALREAFQWVRGDVVVIQDADLEYDPADYQMLLEPILDGRADVVYGTRFLGGPHRVLLFWHYVGNKMVTLFSNMFTNLNLTDMETGYKVFRRQVLDGLNLKSDRFGFEPEFTAKVARHGGRIYEVPISYSGRDYNEGKKITWRDGFAAVLHIIRYRLFD